MRNIEQTLLEQMKFTDREIEKRRRLFDVTDADLKTLLSCKRIVIERLDWAIDEFYARQVNNREIALIIGDSSTLGRLKGAMRSYIVDLFGGSYDDAYVNSRLRVGKVHWQIGVTPQYFLSALRLLFGVLCAVIEEVAEDAIDFHNKREALLKILFFDSHLVFDTYINALQSEVMAAQTEASEYADSLEKIVAKRTEQLQTLALTDELTRVNNKRAFEQFAQREFANAKRSAHEISIIYVDINDFKMLNDTMGHNAGDDLLCLVAKKLTEAARASDIVSRMGGDEFCILLPGSDLTTARNVAERFATLMHEDSKAMVGASVGIASTGPHQFMTVDELLDAADQSMYRAKQAKTSSQMGAVRLDPAVAAELAHSLPTEDQDVDAFEAELCEEPTKRDLSIPA